MKKPARLATTRTTALRAVDARTLEHVRGGRVIGASYTDDWEEPRQSITASASDDWMTPVV